MICEKQNGFHVESNCGRSGKENQKSALCVYCLAYVRLAPPYHCSVGLNHVRKFENPFFHTSTHSRACLGMRSGRSVVHKLRSVNASKANATKKRCI